jgi:hypothetical protein
MLQLTAGTTWKSTNLLALEHPPYGEVLQLSGSPEIHFLFNPLSMRIDRRYAELERRGYLTRRMAMPDQLQDLQFAVSQAIQRPGHALPSDRETYRKIDFPSKHPPDG